jgi:SOS-response transcriptional repressor LexA
MKITTISFIPFTKNYDDNDIFNYIIHYKKQYDGISPSYREIKDHCNISSISVVKVILERLVAAEKIKLIPGKAGGIMVIGGQWTFPPMEEK